MNGKGFIKVPRALLNEWRDKLTQEEIGILINLMAMANYEDVPRRAPKGDYLKRGQLVTSSRAFAKRFNLSESRAYRLFKRWERLGIIKRETLSETESGTPNGTLLTLEFYESSQGERNSDRNSIRNESEDSIRRDKKEKKGEEVPPPPLLYGTYCNVALTEDEYRELKSHIPAELFDARINKTSQGIHDRWKGYEGPHFDIIRKWAVADGCWLDHPKPSPMLNEVNRRRRELIDQFGRDKYDRAALKLGIDDPTQVGDLLRADQSTITERRLMLEDRPCRGSPHVV